MYSGKLSNVILINTISNIFLRMIFYVGYVQGSRYRILLKQCSLIGNSRPLLAGQLMIWLTDDFRLN